MKATPTLLYCFSSYLFVETANFNPLKNDLLLLFIVSRMFWLHCCKVPRPREGGRGGGGEVRQVGLVGWGVGMESRARR